MKTVPKNITLGEYRDMIIGTGLSEDSLAVKYFDDKIAASAAGRDEEVLAAPSQMIILIYSLICEGK